VPSIQPAITAYASNGMTDSVPAPNAPGRALKGGSDACLYPTLPRQWSGRSAHDEATVVWLWSRSGSLPGFAVTGNGHEIVGLAGLE
jgi:hypothetical protein